MTGDEIFRTIAIVCRGFGWSFDYVFRELPLALLERFALFEIDSQREKMLRDIVVEHTSKPRELYERLSGAGDEKPKKEPSIRELVGALRSAGFNLIERKGGN